MSHRQFWSALSLITQLTSILGLPLITLFHSPHRLNKFLRRTYDHLVFYGCHSCKVVVVIVKHCLGMSFAETSCKLFPLGLITDLLFKIFFFCVFLYHCSNYLMTDLLLSHAWLVRPNLFSIFLAILTSRSL